MRWIACGLVASAALLCPRMAEACPVSSGFVAIIHSELPTPLPTGTVVANVKFGPGNGSAMFGAGMKARIKRMVQGNYRGKYLLVRQYWRSSCSYPFDNGRSGFIIGIPRGYESGMLIVDPIEVSRSQKHRLSDGFQLTPTSASTGTEGIEDAIRRTCDQTKMCSHRK